MAMDLKEIESLIKEALTDATVEIQDLAGDGNHYSATVTSKIFSIFEIAIENPHCGASGVPFINKQTSLLLISLLIKSLVS